MGHIDLMPGCGAAPVFSLMIKDGSRMANDKKKQVEQITDMEVDFAQWYTDVCKKAELIDYSSIKGMFIYRPMLCHLGEHPAGDGPSVQGDRPRERVSAHADPRVPAPEGEGPCGGLCP